MESNLDNNFRSLRITSLDGDDDEVGEVVDETMEIEIKCTAATTMADDEDEEEEDVEVKLGFADKPQNPRLLLRHHFPSKAGGTPAWLDPVDLPSGNSSICGFCGEPLQFVLQIYACASEKESAFHRMLYVFMCPSMSCLLRDQHEQWKHREGNPRRSVKVFRCQLPRDNKFYSSELLKCNGSDKPLTEGASLCYWCGTWKGEKKCSSCKIARYCSEKHQKLHWQSGHKNDCLKIICSSETSNLVLPATGKVSSGIVLPEYEISIDEECNYDSDISEESISSSAMVPSQNKPDEAMQSLMDQFEADADNKSWASFQERIAKAPSQILRYCRDLNAGPLWALSAGRPSNTDIPSCSFCKGPLCYEFQIMPQLLYYFGVKNEPDSLDWATIVIYTCFACCDSSMVYKEEFPWVQLYPTTRPTR